MTFRIWVALHFVFKIDNHRSLWSDFHVKWKANHWTCQSKYHGVKYLGQKVANSILVRFAKLLRLSIYSTVITTEVILEASPILINHYHQTDRKCAWIGDLFRSNGGTV